MVVNERSGGERFDVQLARREQYLAVAPVDQVAVVIDGYEIVVGPNFLKLAKGLEQWLAIPQAHVLDCRRIGLNVLEGERRVAAENFRLHAVEPQRTAG